MIEKDEKEDNKKEKIRKKEELYKVFMEKRGYLTRLYRRPYLEAPSGWDWTPSRIIITILLTIGLPFLFTILYLVSGMDKANLNMSWAMILTYSIFAGLMLLYIYYGPKEKYWRKIDPAKRGEYRWRSFLICASIISTIFSLALISGLINWFLY